MRKLQTIDGYHAHNALFILHEIAMERGMTWDQFKADLIPDCQDTLNELERVAQEWREEVERLAKAIEETKK